MIDELIIELQQYSLGELLLAAFLFSVVMSAVVALLYMAFRQEKYHIDYEMKQDIEDATRKQMLDAGWTEEEIRKYYK